MMALAGLEPFPAVASPVRAIARLPQRSVVTVATNVPGPREVLYASAGRCARSSRTSRSPQGMTTGVRTARPATPLKELARVLTE
jgi:diacylglycerol O-acyltransferase